MALERGRCPLSFDGDHMLEMKFTEEDKQKFIEFLNTVAKSAEFKMKTEEIINYFKLLSYMQQKILPKIEANILEVKKVINAEETVSEDKKKGKK
jgi:hypothetical protein